MKKIEYNISRLEQLLSMYRLAIPEFLALISKGLKTPIASREIFTKEIKISYLKRIDKIFEKGLHYYLDPKSPETSEEASIFFRKKNFATDNLNIGAIKIVNQFEEVKLSLSAIAKLSDLKFIRKIPKYSIKDNPKEVANTLRKIFYPKFSNKKREFFKSLISKFADQDIFVFEFIETWNKKNKANIDGFFLKPNVIVLKRYQTFRREIFTLAHELGHYLLEEEEIERLNYQSFLQKNVSKIERWCNDFAYYFLIGSYADSLDSLERASASNDYHFDIIKTISDNTHLSQIALFTRLLLQNQISKLAYNNVKNEFDEKYRKSQEAKEKQKQKMKELGLKQRGAIAKPIDSPLFISTIQNAFYGGVLNEYEVCKKLNIKPEKLEEYIQ